VIALFKTNVYQLVSKISLRSGKFFCNFQKQKLRVIVYVTWMRSHTSQVEKLWFIPRSGWLQRLLFLHIKHFNVYQGKHASLLDKHKLCLYKPLEIIIVLTVGLKAAFCFDVCLIRKHNIVTVILTSFFISSHHVELFILLIPCEEF
jgi:hypothetical protein